MHDTGQELMELVDNVEAAKKASMFEKEKHLNKAFSSLVKALVSLERRVKTMERNHD